MRTRPVSTIASDVAVEVFDEPLPAIRRILADADEALLGVAFVQQRGVNLLERQLNELGGGRLVTTTVFGATTQQGLETARARGLSVRILNPSQGTFHPKLYVARHGEQLACVVGSANLTSGLVTNVEAVAVLRGPRDAPPLARLWERAESWWTHVDAVDWTPGRIPVPPEVLDASLLAAIESAVAISPDVPTLSDRKPNLVRDVTPDGVWVETQRSRRLGRPPSSLRRG